MEKLQAFVHKIFDLPVQTFNLCPTHKRCFKFSCGIKISKHLNIHTKHVIGFPFTRPIPQKMGTFLFKINISLWNEVLLSSLCKAMLYGIRIVKSSPPQRRFFGAVLSKRPEMDTATRFTLRSNTASVTKVRFFL